MLRGPCARLDPISPCRRLPPGIEWIGDPVDSIEPVTARGPVLVHFFDLAQLNSVRVLPYLRAWHERYAGDGLALIGVHSPRFPFTQPAGVVADAVERLGIDWPVAVDVEFAIWRAYEPHGWPALFLWGRGGALRWYHLGEGEYAGTEEPIRETLADSGAEREWPPLVEPMRPSDAPGATVIAPTPEPLSGWIDRGALVASRGRPAARARVRGRRRLCGRRRRGRDRCPGRRRIPCDRRRHTPRPGRADRPRANRAPPARARALAGRSGLLRSVRAAAPPAAS